MVKIFTRMCSTAIVHYSFGLMTVFAISGCAQNYLYNAERDKQGQAATKAASEAKLIDTVTTIEKRFDGLLSLELDATKTRSAHIRELEIRELVFKTNPIEDTWIKRIEDRLTWLVGKDNWNKVDPVMRKIDVAQNLMEERRLSFITTFPGTALSCDILNKTCELPSSIANEINNAQKSEADTLIKYLCQACNQLLAAEKELDALFVGVENSKTGLANAVSQLKSDQEEKRKNDESREAAQKAVKEAIETYTRETKKLEKPENKDTYTARVVAAAQRLRKKLEEIEKGEGAIGIEVLAKERLNHVEAVLTAIAKEDVDTSKWDENLRTAVAVAGSLPALADEAREMLRGAGQPRLIPLMMAREHQRQIAEEATKVAAVLARRVAASERIVAAYRSEFTTLINIHNNNTLKDRKQGSWRSQSLLQLNKNLVPEDKRILYELLGIYFDDVPRFQSEQRFWEYRRIATFYEETIERSKSAALMWQNLLDGIANTLAGYHSAGIKPEDMARLLQALGVITIGVGVNK